MMIKRPIVTMILTILFCLVGAALLIFTDFGFLYEYDSYNGIYSYHYIGLFYFPATLFILAVLLLILLVILIQIIGLAWKKAGSGIGIQIASIAFISIALLIDAVGTVIFIVVAQDYWNWDFEAACYAGAITPILVIITSTISLILVLVRRKKDKNEKSLKKGKK
ncbi:MAG: hypothetical protein ACMUIE_05980 [Thermoplasmatota archaeon]